MLTMRYRILDSADHFEEAQKDIELVLRLMNERFTWPNGPLSLTPCAPPKARGRGGRAREVARGEIVVADDRWSAALVFSFLRWASQRLPAAQVELLDESGLADHCEFVFRANRLTMQLPHDARQRRLAEQRLGGR